MCGTEFTLKTFFFFFGHLRNNEEALHGGREVSLKPCSALGKTFFFPLALGSQRHGRPRGPLWGKKKISSIISLSPAGPQGERWPGEGALWPLVGCHPHPH